MAQEKITGANFKDTLVARADINGYWDENYRETVLKFILCQYKPDIVKEWFINDIMVKDGKVWLLWRKRFRPLSESEYNEQYQM